MRRGSRISGVADYSSERSGSGLWRPISSSRTRAAKSYASPTSILLGIPIVGELPTMLQALGLVITGVGLLAAIGVVRFPLRAAPPRHH